MFKPFAMSLILALSSASRVSATEVKSVSSIAVGVSLDVPEGTTTDVSLTPDKFAVAFSMATKGQPQATLSNVGEYVTLVAHKILPAPGEATEQALATIGCSYNVVTAPDRIMYTAASCNNVPLTWSDPAAGGPYPLLIPGAMLGAGYELRGVVTVIYSLPNDQTIYRRSITVPVRRASAPSPQSDVLLPARRFSVMAEYTPTAIAPVTANPRTVNVNALAVWVRSAQDVGATSVIANFAYGLPGSAPTPVVNLSCLVGPLRAGQAIAYQGESCNVANVQYPLPSTPGELLVQFAVQYPDGQTCQSKWVPAVALTANRPSPSGIAIYDTGNDCE